MSEPLSDPSDTGPEAAPEVPVLDPSVRALFADDDAGYAELVEIFLRGAMQRLEELEAAGARGDTVHVGDLAHALASSAEAVGALRLGLCCRALEVEPHGGSEHLETIRDALRQVEARLRSAARRQPDDGTSMP